MSGSGFDTIHKLHLFDVKRIANTGGKNLPISLTKTATQYSSITAVLNSPPSPSARHRRRRRRRQTMAACAGHGGLTVQVTNLGGVWPRRSNSKVRAFPSPSLLNAPEV